MFGYIVRRVISGILVLLVVSVATFALFFYGPEDPALAYCPETHCSPERLDRVRTSLGLERPVTTQYAEYMKGIVVGNDFHSGTVTIPCNAPCLGVSFKQRVDVAEYLWERFPATLSVAVGAAATFLTVGMALGIWSARVRGSTLDKMVVSSCLFLNAMPYYLTILLAWLFLVSKWGIFPESGYVPITRDPVGWAKGMLLAWAVLGLIYSTAYTRFSRGSMVEALNEDFVRTARAKGVGERRVTFQHALRAAIVPVVTIFGLDFAGLLSGTVFVEKIFDIHGIGVASLSAIGQKDLPMISATVLLAAAFVVAANLLVDLVYSLIDPRVRLT